jgi:hypothetical protein
MAQDDLDAMLQGSDQAPASQAQNNGQGDDITQADQPVTQQTPEEIEFNKLNGSTQERIRRLVAEKRKYQELSQQVPTPQFPFNPMLGNIRTPEQEQGLRTLAQLGVATDEKVDSKLSELRNQLWWEQRNQGLETKWNGVNGMAQYVKEEVEDYMRSHPQYSQSDPEDVFLLHMFPAEYRNYIVSAGTKTGKTSQTQSLRPTKNPGQSESGYESILDRVNPEKYSDALQYADDHRKEVEAAVLALTPGE